MDENEKKSFNVLDRNTAKTITLNAIINVAKYGNFITEGNERIAEAAKKLRTSIILETDTKTDIKILSYFYNGVGYRIEPICDRATEEDIINSKDGFIKNSNGKYKCKIHW